MKEKNISVFGADVISNNGYIYSNTDKLSCKFSNGRMSEAVRQMAGDVKGKRIIDIGCGDGHYTREILAMGPAFIQGIDANEAAIKMAQQKAAGLTNIQFEVMDIYDLPPNKQYDIAVVRGLLHHLYDVKKAIAAICKTAKVVIVIEPNGYNPVLKIIEKVSPYHVAHEEKSYLPSNLDKWFRENNGKIVKSKYIGLVPIFSPDALAKICKFFEPFVEGTPLLRNIACAQYVQKISFEH